MRQLYSNIKAKENKIRSLYPYLGIGLDFIVIWFIFVGCTTIAFLLQFILGEVTTAGWFVYWIIFWFTGAIVAVLIWFGVMPKHKEDKKVILERVGLYETADFKYEGKKG